MRRDHDATSTHNVPIRFDPLIGRRDEVSLIRRLIQSSARLVTVTGGAGVGKSRLAIAAAESLARSFSGVWYIDVRERGADVPTTIAHELKIPATDEPVAAVARAIGDDDALLVLDDADEVTGTISDVVDALLGSCSGVRFIVTSREPLASRAQSLVAVEPLPHRDLTPSSDAVRLFVDRALAADALFRLDDDTLSAVVRICDATAGVPLAIELAAAQLQFMDAETLARRMDGQLDALEPAGPPSRSLRAAVEDSWERCTPLERRIWCDLAVLAPGWDLDLGEAMAARSTDSVQEARAAVKQLIRRSVVHRRRSGEVVRYELLPALREFGVERAEAPEDARRHFVSCLLVRLHDAERQWFSGHQGEISRRLLGDIPHIRRAVAAAAAQGRPDTAIEVAVTAWRQAWVLHGSADELAVWLGVALGCGTPSPYWASVGHALRAFVFALTDRPVLARDELTAATADRDRLRADRQTALARESDIAIRSAAEAVEKDDALAARMLRELMSDLGEDAYRFGPTNTPQRLAARLHALGDRAAGNEVDDAIVERARVAGDRFEWSFALTTRAQACAIAGELASTERDARDALILKRRLGNGLGVAQALELLAAVAAERTDAGRGATLLGAAAARWRDVGSIRANYPPYFVELDATERALRHRLGDASFDRAFRYGAALSEEEGIDLALHGVVEAHARAGVPHSAAAVARTTVLTPRETQIASLVAEGETNKQIARRLVVSVRTVESHVQNALVKLGLRSRTELAVWYRERAG